jgi:hypothetical protein
MKLYHILAAALTLSLVVGCAGHPKSTSFFISPSVLATSYGVFIYEYYLTPTPVATDSQQAISLAKEGWKPAETISAQGWSVRFQRETILPGASLDSSELNGLSSEDGITAYFHSHSVAGR